MKKYLNKLGVKISRIRFWHYLAGPYLISFFYLLSINAIDFNFYNIFLLILGFIIFTYPANLLVYSINDIYDEETDLNNPKKSGKELRINDENRVQYVNLFFFSLSLMFIYGLFINGIARFFLFLFLLLGIFYSAPPFRFKSKPILDFVSNILYIVPGFVLYAQFLNELPPFWVVIASSFWVFSMHLFSAIPDIKEDTEAKIITSAVYFGKKLSIFLCSFFWGLSFFLMISNNLSVISALYIIYPILPLITLNNKVDISKVYWLYPKINFLMGFLLFLMVYFR